MWGNLFQSATSLGRERWLNEKTFSTTDSLHNVGGGQRERRDTGPWFTCARVPEFAHAGGTTPPSACCVVVVEKPRFQMSPLGTRGSARGATRATRQVNTLTPGSAAESGRRKGATCGARTGHRHPRQRPLHPQRTLAAPGSRDGSETAGGSTSLVYRAHWSTGLPCAYTTEVTKRDRIVSELRQMIREGTLPRGSRIQQDILATQFHTSITPVREALVLLEAEGLLVSAPNRGVSVADADFSQVKGVYIQRMLLEPYAMRRATRRISKRDIDSAEQLLGRMEEYPPRAQVVPVSELNRQFHFLFYNNCGNDALSAQIESLWQRWPWDLLEVIKQRPQVAGTEHRSMIEAVRQGDLEGVAEATKEHLRQSYLALGLYLTGEEQVDAFHVDQD